jgi:hypothetical protein
MTDFERLNFDSEALEIINKELNKRGKNKKVVKSDFMKEKIKDLKGMYKERR